MLKHRQLIVNELSSNAKALILLYFLKKIKAYAYIYADLHADSTHIHADMPIDRGVGMGHVGVWGTYA